MLSDRFHDYADQSICSSVLKNKSSDTMGAIKKTRDNRRAWLSQTGESGHNRFDWTPENACEIKSPAGRNQKARTRPRGNSEYHANFHDVCPRLILAYVRLVDQRNSKCWKCFGEVTEKTLVEG